jgi:cobalt-zinc-cadmium efflux system protein
MGSSSRSSRIVRRTLDLVNRTTRLTVVLCLNVALIGGLVTVGVTAHSLGVLAAAGDYVADAIGIGVSLLAIMLSRRPATVRRPNGYPKATTVAALLNGALLLLIVVLVIAEGVRRLATGAGHVHGLPIVIASSAAAVAMLIGALILKSDAAELGDDDGDRANMRAVLLDTVADAAAAAGAAIAGLIIVLTGGHYWLDPAVALVIAGVVGYHVIILLQQVARTLHEPIH